MIESLFEGTALKMVGEFSPLSLFNFRMQHHYTRRTLVIKLKHRPISRVLVSRATEQISLNVRGLSS